ncbi:MAG TPA: acyl-CoA dehydrogenase family protein [Pseudonocardia sp.]|nr:acyl-CoA dehydrogenase family protein [Pseudonocardia sp.]
MDFRFTPDELEVHRYARTSARTHLPLSRLSDPATDVAAWAAFASDGWTQACLGEDGPNDLPFLAGLAREVGALAGGEAFVHNGWLLPRLIMNAREPERAEWLAALSMRPGFLADSDRTAQGDRVAAGRPGFETYRLEVGDGDEPRLHRLGPTTADFHALGGLSVQLGRAAPADHGGPASTLSLGAGLGAGLGADELADLRTGADVLRAAGLVGLAAEILATTVAYVSEREQFGQVIGRFQALKHLCADVHTRVEVAWLAVLHAAVTPEDPLAVHSAAYLAASTAMDAARVGAQLHGGMGFTWESNLHWLLKAALDGQLTTGPAGQVAQRIGALLVDQGVDQVVGQGVDQVVGQVVDRVPGRWAGRG